MTCDRALEALLDADFIELRSGVTPLALHVRGCDRCRRIADTLVANTQQLAVRLPVAAVRRNSSIRRYAFAPAAVAAAILVMLSVRRERPAAVTETESTLSPVVVDSFPPAPVAPVAARPLAARPLRAYPRSVPVVAVKMSQPEPIIAEPAISTLTTRAVTVTPPAGARAVVMQTTDPKLVVVWLY